MQTRQTLCFFATNNQTTDLTNLSFRCYDYNIEPKQCITILGYRLSSNLSTDNQINYLSQQCFHRINTIKSTSDITDKQTRLQLANAVIMGKLNYTLPLFSNMSKYAHDKFHKIELLCLSLEVSRYINWQTQKRWSEVPGKTVLSNQHQPSRVL